MSDNDDKKHRDPGEDATPIHAPIHDHPLEITYDHVEIEELLCRAANIHWIARHPLADPGYRKVLERLAIIRAELESDEKKQMIIKQIDKFLPSGYRI